MAFESTKREVSELYAFARLLADGCVPMDRGERRVMMVERMEHDGPRRYVRSAEKGLGKGFYLRKGY